MSGFEQACSSFELIYSIFEIYFSNRNFRVSYFFRF